MNKDIKERHLILIEDSEMRVVELDLELVTLGRDKSTNIVVECDVISRIHAKFFRIPGSESKKYDYRFYDGRSQLNPSRNGTTVNGRRCYIHLLKHGDILCFGNLVRAIYLKIELNDERFEKYISLILKSNKVNEKTREDINIMSRILSTVRSSLSLNDPTSIMLNKNFTSSEMMNSFSTLETDRLEKCEKSMDKSALLQKWVSRNLNN